jgi:hypothetical protein
MIQFLSVAVFFCNDFDKTVNPVEASESGALTMTVHAGTIGAFTISDIIELSSLYIQLPSPGLPTIYDTQHYEVLNHCLKESEGIIINFYTFSKTVSFNRDFNPVFIGYSRYSDYTKFDYSKEYYNSPFFICKLSFTTNVFFDTRCISSINFVDFTEIDNDPTVGLPNITNANLNSACRSVNLSTIIRFFEIMKENVSLKSLGKDSHSISIAGLDAGKYFVKIKVNFSNR